MIPLEEPLASIGWNLWNIHWLIINSICINYTRKRASPIPVNPFQLSLFNDRIQKAIGLMHNLLQDWPESDAAMQYLLVSVWLSIACNIQDNQSKTPSGIFRSVPQSISFNSNACASTYCLHSNLIHIIHVSFRHFNSPPFVWSGPVCANRLYIVM